ncbi:MAG TPA: tetratricopeptide repeat protein [Pyrinomonadaceae bacterium]|nr:tetratricopeptide repeat protein [Pyrinomonadaceae bacterium]
MFLSRKGRSGFRRGVGGPAVREDTRRRRLSAMIGLLLALSSSLALAQTNKTQDELEHAAELIRDHRLTQAEQQLNNILRATPDNAPALNLLGTIRAQQGRLSEAENLLLRSARIDPGFVGVHMNLAFLYMLRNAPEKTLSELKEVVKLDPDHIEANYKLARLLLSRGQTDEAINILERAKSISSASPLFLPLLGDAYLKKGNALKAEENYRSAIDAQPNNAEAILGLAKISQSRADIKGVAQYLARAHEAAGDSAEVLYKVGATSLALGVFDQARASLEQAAKLKPDNPTYLIALGAALLKNGDLFTAERMFHRALEIQPESAQGQMYLGYVLYKQKKFPEAKSYLEKAAKADASVPESFYYLGVILQEENEDERAIGLLEKAIQLSPSFAHAHVALGAGYLKLKDYQRAQKELELGVKLNPEDSKAHYQLALLYARLKDPKRAQAEMQIVEKLKAVEQSQKKEGDTFVIAPGVPNSP